MLLKASVSEMTNESSAGLTTTAATTTAAKASPLSALSGLKRPAEVVLRKPEPTLPAQATEETDSDNDTEFDPSQLPPALRLRYEHCQAYDDRKQRHHGAILLHRIDKAYEAYFDDAEWLAKEFGLLLDGGEPTALIENLHSRNAIIEIVRKGRSVAVFHCPDETESSTVYGPETEAGHAAPYLSTDEPRLGHVPSGVPSERSDDTPQKQEPDQSASTPSRPAPGPIETLAKSADPLQLIAAAFQRTLAAKSKAEAILKEYEAAAKALDDLLHGVAIAFAEQDLEPMADGQTVEPEPATLHQTIPVHAEPESSAASPPRAVHTFHFRALSLPLDNVMVGDIGIPPGIVKDLNAAGIVSVESLVRQRNDEGLTKIPRIGRAKAEAIEELLDDLLQQRRDHEGIQAGE